MSDKEAQRRELQELVDRYDGRVIKTAREARDRVRMVCGSCGATRMVSSLAFQIACKRCGASPMVPWWVRS
jgi:hypothetical protein